ncbi:DEAD/DEAH box helicase [Thiohalorhabdus sp. Cl-TMA]|uniref:DEAD/DEAH box helicase n=1 Tax=Thiohalorhabdus methylotrophus TaxID=3242694 RepID=A0ABV4TSZ2_9GAMM
MAIKKAHAQTPLDTLRSDLEGEDRFCRERAHYRYVPPRPATYGDLDLDPRIAEVLAARGMERVYAHQAEGVAAARRGEHVVAMTPTASGKSLIYNLPVLEAALADPEARALYVFPLKGLEQDQVGGLDALMEALDLHPEPGPRERTPVRGAEVYDGDTPGHRRTKIRQRLPTALFTNPDMLHLGLLPHHDKWAKLFANLRYVVVDEIHTYRGVFGSHAAQVFRRLRRVARHYGSEPQFIACSATIANPGELAESLLGVSCTAVTDSGAPSGGKHFYFVNPQASPYTTATDLFLRCLETGLKSIAFTRARRATELVYQWAAERGGALAERISPYRAGFLPGERRAIEQRLFSGELDGVISTSALELGVDIGELDACVLVGYPGSVASTWQRAGRVGRRGEDAVIFLVAGNDALDQYFMRHPETFFERSHEAVVVDPANPRLLGQHLPCAAAELPLGADDPVYIGDDPDGFRGALADLEAGGDLRREGAAWYSALPGPQRAVGIRSIGPAFRILDEAGKPLGDLDGDRVLREAFPGAVYLHRGRNHRILELNLEGRYAVARPEKVHYYTRALSDEDTEVREVRRRRRGNRLIPHWGDLRITRRVTGYERRRTNDGKRIGTHNLDLPPTTFDTEGLWLPVTGAAQSAVREAGGDLPGALHAAEHAIIKMLPLFALCDATDVGGVSYPLFPPLGGPAIFVYDGYEGGIGFSRRGFETLGDWLTATLHALRACPCQAGCPSCVQDPQCGNANEPLDKGGAVALLAHWLGSAPPDRSRGVS